jgi:hypothetical protein
VLFKRPSSLASGSILALVLLASGCAQHDAPVAKETAKPAVPTSNVYNDTAQWLAGIPGRADGPFHGLESDPAWQKYSTALAEKWKTADTKQFGAVDAFQKRELAGQYSPSKFLFYPLSGPDVLYATRFFPEATTMVFAGLEPVGHIRQPESYRAENLDKELGNWEKGLASIFNRSFFVTSEMDSHFRGRVADGLLQMMLLLLARSGHAIEDVRYGHFEQSGEFQPQPETQEKKPEAVEISYHRGTENVTRKVYYYSGDLAGDFDGKAFPKFVDKQGRPDTLVKSGSFLLHWKQCEELRTFILAKSNLILEDDTGVPYRFFKEPEWKVTLYGEYSAPDRPFKSQYQADLAKAFQDPSRVKELGFSLGYGAWRRPSSLILAKRVGTQTASNAAPATH